ncbi:MAG: EAL domain-containing protein [Caldimicrobium sp.]
MFAYLLKKEKTLQNQFHLYGTLYSELNTHFQPIFSAKSGAVFGYEALMRHRSKSLNIKKLFLEAKKNGSILLLDLIGRFNAIKRASELRMDTYLFINICPEVLSHPEHKPGLTDQIAEALEFSKDKIVLEVTEHSAIENCELFLKAVNFYKERGYKIALDDFGAGCIGPKLLTLFELDFIKIDQYFIQTIEEHSFSKIFVEFIVTICKDLNITTVAEGIENERQLNHILTLGVDLLQGFYLGRPNENLYVPQYQFPYM